MDSGRHKFSENIWLVWSKRSYSGDKVGCDACGRTDGRMRINVTDECDDKVRIMETEFAIQNKSKLPSFFYRNNSSNFNQGFVQVRCRKVSYLSTSTSKLSTTGMSATRLHFDFD